MNPAISENRYLINASDYNIDPLAGNIKVRFRWVFPGFNFHEFKLKLKVKPGPFPGTSSVSLNLIFR